MKTYENKVVLITGGASGIGRSLGAQLVAAGARVVLADLKADQVQAVATELGCAGVAADVRDMDAMRAAVRAAETAAGGHIDVMINCAGIAQIGEAHTFEHHDWTRVIDVNLYGVVNGVHAVYADMVARKRGQIINIASVAGLFPSAGQASYVASKYGVVGLTHALRAEAGRHGVQVSVVCPGIIHTAMRDGLPVKDGRGEAVRAMLPQGASVDACAKTILRGAARNKATIIVTPMAYGLSWLMRFAPRVGLWLNGLSFRMMLRRVGAA